MNISTEKMQELNNVMDALGRKNLTMMGLNSYENGAFDVLLWLLDEDTEIPEDLINIE